MEKATQGVKRPIPPIKPTHQQRLKTVGISLGEE